MADVLGAAERAAADQSLAHANRIVDEVISAYHIGAQRHTPDATADFLGLIAALSGAPSQMYQHVLAAAVLRLAKGDS